MPWKVLIVGGVAISLLTASFSPVAIGRRAAFDTPEVQAVAIGWPVSSIVLTRTATQG